MRIRVNELNVEEVIELVRFIRSGGYDCHFTGAGNGEVLLEVLLL